MHSVGRLFLTLSIPFARRVFFHCYFFSSLLPFEWIHFSLRCGSRAISVHNTNTMSASLCTQVCGWSKPNTASLIADVMRILLSTVLLLFFFSSKFKPNVWKFGMHQHEKSKQKKKIAELKTRSLKMYTMRCLGNYYTNSKCNKYQFDSRTGELFKCMSCRVVFASFFIVIIIIFFYRFCNWHQIGARISLSAGYLFHRMLSINIIITIGGATEKPNEETKWIKKKR